MGTGRNGPAGSHAPHVPPGRGTVFLRLEVAGFLRPLHQGFYCPVVVPLRPCPFVRAGRQVRGCELFKYSVPGTVGRNAGRLSQYGKWHCGEPPCAGHRPERGYQDGEAENHRPGCHEDSGTETSRPQRLRYGHTSQRPCHLRAGRQGAVKDLAEPERANVSAHLSCPQYRRHPAGIGKRCVLGRRRGAEIQLFPCAAGLPAGAGPYEQSPIGGQPHPDRAFLDDFQRGRVRAFRDAGAFSGRRRHVLRRQCQDRQHDYAGSEAGTLPQRFEAGDAGKREIHEL